MPTGLLLRLLATAPPPARSTRRQPAPRGRSGPPGGEELRQEQDKARREQDAAGARQHARAPDRDRGQHRAGSQQQQAKAERRDRHGAEADRLHQAEQVRHLAFGGLAGDRVQAEVLRAVVRQGQANPDPGGHDRGQRQPLGPGAAHRVPEPKQPQRHQDEADHGEQVRGNPATGVHRLGGTLDRGLVLPGPHRRVEDEQHAGDREREGSRSAAGTGRRHRVSSAAGSPRGDGHTGAGWPRHYP